jgi:hypothetical protein
MKLSPPRITYFISLLLIVATLTLQGASGPSSRTNGNSSQEHIPGLTAKVTLANGATEIVRIDGIGCTESMCSMLLTKAKTAGNTVVEIWFDSIAAIRDIRQNDAVFVTKDGAERRLTFISDFRVLYVSNGDGAKKKIDLAKIKALDVVDR